MISKIKILRHNLALWEGHFDYFHGQKTRFMDFLKVALMLFGNFLGIIFDIERPTCKRIFSMKGG